MSDEGGKSLLRFQQRMQAIPKAARKAVAPALMKSAYDISDIMESLVAEDTGDLKNSITVTGPEKSTPPYSQPGGSMTVPENAVAITVGSSDVRYPHLIEYGHSGGFVAGGAQGERGQAVPPQPFFWPGYRLGRAKALRSIKRVIGKAIREAK